MQTDQQFPSLNTKLRPSLLAWQQPAAVTTGRLEPAATQGQLTVSTCTVLRLQACITCLCIATLLHKWAPQGSLQCRKPGAAAAPAAVRAAAADAVKVKRAHQKPAPNTG